MLLLVMMMMHSFESFWYDSHTKSRTQTMKKWPNETSFLLSAIFRTLNIQIAYVQCPTSLYIFQTQTQSLTQPHTLSLFPSAIVFVRVSLYHLSIFIFIFIKWKFTIKFIAKYEDALFFIRDIFRPTINWSDMIIWQISAKQYHHNWIWIVSWKFFSQNHLLKLTVNHMLLQPMMLMRWVATHWLCVFPSWFNWF